MVRKTSQVFKSAPAPAQVEDNRVLVNWVARQMNDMQTYVVALEERIRPAVAWASLVDQSISAAIPFTIWPVDTVIRDDIGEGDYQVTISALVLGTGGQTFVEFGLSRAPTDPITEFGLIPLKNGEELYLSDVGVIPQAKQITLWIRGENVDVTVAQFVAVRIGG